MHRWRTCTVLVTVALAVQVGRARNVHADPTPTEIQAARDLFAKAEVDEDAGQWSAALDKLRRAASVKPTPGIRFHIALCEEKLNQLVAALSDYTAADQSAREQNNKDVIDAVSEPLRTLRIRVPTLTLDVPRASEVHVELDGKEVTPGLFGVAMPVEPGMHRVQARAHGKRPFTTQVQLSEREAQTATVRWIDIPTVDAQEDPRRDATPEGVGSSERRGGVRVGAIVATVSAAALVGVGIGAYVAADGAQSTLYAQCKTIPSCDSLRTPVRAWDAVALTSWIAAAGVTTLAIVLWLKPSSRAPESARIELRPLGLAFAGSF